MPALTPTLTPPKGDSTAAPRKPLHEVRSDERFTPGLFARPALCVAIGLFSVAVRLSGTPLSPLVALGCFGGAVLAAAFLLAWAAEALQVDISKGLAMAVLAFIAVLPEYAVDLYFAFTAAHNPAYAQYAAANMTGSNRLLIGIGWSTVALVGVYALRKRGARGPKPGGEEAPAVELGKGHSVDLVVLTMATLWSFLLPLSHRIAVWHGVGLLLLFGFYIWRVSGAADNEPELAGVAQALGNLPTSRRRPAVGGLLLVATAVLLAAAKPFAEALIASGQVLGVDQFLLVQWLAPLASEAPELLVATLFAARCQGQAGLAALLSSKVNQWTLLVGTLPIVYSAAGGAGGALPLDSRQVEELVLTACQCLLGVTFLLNGRLYLWEALALLGLFLVQLPFPQSEVRYGLSALYIALSLLMLVRDRRYIVGHLRVTFVKREAPR